MISGCQAEDQGALPEQGDSLPFSVRRRASRRLSKGHKLANPFSVASPTVPTYNARSRLQFILS